MTEQKEKNTIERSREHFANERTFLAWIRTSIALMGFGFIIVKFAVFLRQISVMLETKQVSSNGYGDVVGVIMVALGVIIAVFAFFQYKKNERQISSNVYYSASLLSLLLLLVILIGGVLLIYYLLSII